jgi:hypothetical protein
MTAAAVAFGIGTKRQSRRNHEGYRQPTDFLQHALHSGVFGILPLSLEKPIIIWARVYSWRFVAKNGQ